MRTSLRTKLITVCDEKILKKGETVGLSFYAFFANKNDDPELLMEAEEWWIKLHALDHFEKAIKIPIAHGEGKYFADEKTMKSLIQNDQILFKYCDENGNITEQSNPNGSLQNIAGIFNKQKNVLGMMPHPERMIDPALSGEDGSIFFENLINNLK